MMDFNRYPYVKNLIIYYASDLDQKLIADLVECGLKSEADAEALSRFVWMMADKMSEDANNGVVVLGSEDNREMLADVEYEVTSIIESAGFIDTWERVSDEENP